MTPSDLRNIYTIGNSCRDALQCVNMALKLPLYFYLVMEKPLDRYFQVWSPYYQVVLLLVGLSFTWNPNFVLDLTFMEFIRKQYIDTKILSKSLMNCDNVLSEAFCWGSDPFLEPRYYVFPQFRFSFCKGRSLQILFHEAYNIVTCFFTTSIIFVSPHFDFAAIRWGWP